MQEQTPSQEHDLRLLVVLRDHLDGERGDQDRMIGCRGGHNDCRAATRMQALS